MTSTTILGTRCKLCRHPLEGDEGVGIPYGDRILWTHDGCAGKARRILKKKQERRQEECVGTRQKRRRSGRVGALH